MSKMPSDIAEDKTTTDRRPPVQLKRQLGVHHGVAVIAGLVIGSGIWVSPRGVVDGCGSPGLTLIIWAVAGGIATLGALCMAELGTTFPQSGEKYVYLEKMFGPFTAFLYLWMYFFMYRPGVNAIKMLTFAKYVLETSAPWLSCPTSDSRDVSTFLIATLLACLLTFINCVRVKWAASCQNLFTSVSVLGLLIISVTGIVWLIKGRTSYIDVGFEDTRTEASGIVLALYSAIFAYFGWSALNFMVEEIKDPYKNLPRAIIIGMLLVTGLYLMVNLAYIVVLGTEEISTSQAVAVSFAKKALGVTWIMPLCMTFNLAGSFNSATLTSSRLCFVGARRGHLPDCLALINIKLLSPVTSLVLQCILVICFCIAVDVYTLLTNLVFLTSFFDCLAVVGMIYLRLRRPDLNRPLKVPLIIPILFTMFMLFLVITPLFTRPRETATGLLLLLGTGVPYYVIFISWTSRPKALSKWSKRTTILIQKIFYSVKQEGDVA